MAQAQGGSGDAYGVQASPPKMLGLLPIMVVNDVYEVFKMDVIEEHLSEWGTHPEYSEIRKSMLEACGVRDDLFSRFEASLSPIPRISCIFVCSCGRPKSTSGVRVTKGYPLV